eukprot:675928-Rhodomonas_salina.1
MKRRGAYENSVDDPASNRGLQLKDYSVSQTSQHDKFDCNAVQTAKDITVPARSVGTCLLYTSDAADDM